MLALSFYSHTLMSWLMFFALGLYGLWSPKERKALLWILFWAVLAASPLFYHQLKFINFYRPMRVLESYYVQINIFLYILALMGFVLALKRRGDYLFFVAVLLSMSTLIFTHRDRFFSGQGLVPLSFLAAFLLEDLRKRCFLKKDNRLNMAFWILLIAVFYCLTPLITFSPLRRSPKFVVTSRIMDKEQKEAGFHEDKGETFYFPNLVNETVQALRQNSREDDIVFSNYNYGGGILAVLAHRAMSNAMLREVLPFKEIDIIDAARLILWFKTPGGGFPQDLREITRLYRLKKIGETQLVYLYLNEDSHFRRRVVRASVPYGVCGSILLLVLLAVSLDCFRPGRGQT